MALPFHFVKGMDRITFIKQEGLKHRPYLGVPPVFTEDVGNVFIAGDMAKLDKSCSNGFAYTMVGEGNMPFGKPRVRD